MSRPEYPTGSGASDAVVKLLEFYGVDAGVMRDPAFHEPWDEGKAEHEQFNEYFAEPEGGMAKFVGEGHDRRKLEEVRPSPGRKCFIADLRSARQCGYAENEGIYKISNPAHSAIQEASKTMSTLARHRAYAVNVPQSVGGWITIKRAEEYLDKPWWFLVEVARQNRKARFQLLASCDADEDPYDEGTMCKVEAYRNTQGLSHDWFRPARIYLKVGTDIPWDNVPSLIHITDHVSAAGILKVGMIRTMGAHEGRSATMLR